MIVGGEWWMIREKFETEEREREMVNLGLGISEEILTLLTRLVVGGQGRMQLSNPGLL